MTDDNPTPSLVASPDRSTDATLDGNSDAINPADHNAHLSALIEGAQTFGLVLDAPTAERFARFAALLEEGNRHLNLTRIRPEDVTTLHFLDSLAPAAAWRFAPGSRLLDVGTGAGFPGVPLALAFPDVDVTLMDSTRKRLTWLNGALAELGVTNAHTLHARAEELAQDANHRERYDVVTARAVAPLATLAGWLLPFVRPGGVAVAYKSQDVAGELTEAQSALNAYGARVYRVAEVLLPNTEITRKMVLLRKTLSVPPFQKSGKGKNRRR